MGTKVPAWPTLESDVLNALVAAFRRRSKAIKHQVSSWEIDTEVEAEVERLDFHFETWGKHRVSLSAWEDGTLWWWVGRSSKTGWEVNYGFHASSELSEAQDVRQAFEDSLLYLEHEDEVRSIWKRFDPQ